VLFAREGAKAFARDSDLELEVAAAVAIVE